MEIRARAQEPVRQYNDIAGRLVGDHLSIHVTRAFIAFGIGPTVATIGMLVLGIAGALLIPFEGIFTVLGFVCIFAYYISDCVDGEVARFHGIEKIEWGFHDFLFHLYVKCSFFLALGAFLVRVTGEPWTFLFGISGLIATLMTKFLNDVATAVTCRQILLRPRSEHQVQLQGLMGSCSPELEQETQGAVRPEWSRLGLVRAVLTNFDLASLVYLGVATLDLWLPTWEWLGMTWSLTALVAIGYGILLPIDFMDRLQTAIRRDEFSSKARGLLKAAAEFRMDEPGSSC